MMGTIDTGSAEYLASLDGTTPDAADLTKPQLVVVDGPVHTLTHPSRTITTDQLAAVAGAGAVRLVNAVQTRAQVTIMAQAAGVVIGGATVTAGTGFPLIPGATVTLNTSAEVWALNTSTPGDVALVAVLSEHHDG